MASNTESEAASAVGSRGSLDPGGVNLGAPRRATTFEADGHVYRIEIRGDTIRFEREQGTSVTLRLGVVLAGVALLSEQRPSPVKGAVNLGVDPKRQPAPKRANFSWGISEDAMLRQKWASGYTVPALARLHDRTPGAIRSRLEKLGLANVDDRQAELFK